MPILEEEKKKIFAFFDKILKDGKEDSDTMEFQDFKTDNGQKFSESAYLYVPDATKPSTWKLRVEESPGKVTVHQLGAAAAALSSGGFRGNKVSIPASEISAIKSKLIALYKKEGVAKEQMPSHLMLDEGGDEEMLDTKRLEDMEKKLQEIEAKDATERKSLEDTYKKSLEDLEKKLSETHAKEVEATNKKLEDTEKRLSERDADLHKERVTKKCDDLVTKGFWPAVVEKVKAVMLEDIKSSIKLSDKEVTFSDALIDILETIPKEVRISFSELSHTMKNVDPNKKFMSEKEVEQYAKEQKITFEEACSTLAKEGKIEV